MVLSGSASDGTEGLRAIKAAGGITFAQEPESAQFRSMPESAIAAGVVDFRLPPEGIASELVRLSRHSYLARFSNPRGELRRKLDPTARPAWRASSRRYVNTPGGFQGLQAPNHHAAYRAGEWRCAALGR